MRKPRLYKGLAYSFPDVGMMAIYTPSDELAGEKLYVLILTPQTQPVAYLLKRLIDEANKPTLLDKLFRRKSTSSVDLINQKLGVVSPDEKQGRVVKVKGAPEYTPERSRVGGQVVKTMPRGLRKIKEAQEAAQDDL